MKRKSEKKLQQRAAEQAKTSSKPGKTAMPVPELMLKILAIILSIILVIGLTLYVLGRMPARGFWTLAAILALIAFVIIPVMRKKFVNRSSP